VEENTRNRIKKLKIKIRSYRIAILKISENTGYSATLIADVLFLRKKSNDKLLQKLEECVDNLMKDRAIMYIENEVLDIDKE